MLAPTDAALGMAVVTDRSVPVRIRRALNIESGLNDGIATPFVTVFLAALLSEEGVRGGSWVLDAIVDIGLAVLVALVVGAVGGRLLSIAARRGWTSHVSEQLCVLSLAILAYVGAVEIGGNGFVSEFTAGLVFGAVARERREAVGFTEDASLFASFLVWVVFGASFVGPVLAGSFDAVAVVYAAVSLTLVRMIPVAIALVGKGFRRSTLAFMGWFGPRGLASVVFTLLAIEELSGTDVDLPLLEIATWTILLSVILHGISAHPLARAYGERIRAGDPTAPELVEVAEPHVRRHFLRSRAAPGQTAAAGGRIVSGGSRGLIGGTPASGSPDRDHLRDRGHEEELPQEHLADRDRLPELTGGHEVPVPGRRERREAEEQRAWDRRLDAPLEEGIAERADRLVRVGEEHAEEQICVDRSQHGLFDRHPAAARSIAGSRAAR